MRRIPIIIGMFFISLYCYSQQNIPSKIIGKLPNIESKQTYQIQVGAFRNTQNANNVLARLKSAGFNPISERYFDLTRVIISNIPAGEVRNHLVKIKSLGFNEVIIREDENHVIKMPDRKDLTEDVNNIIPDDILKALVELGIEINEGRNPPNIEGTYLVTPFRLVKSNFSDSLGIGYQFADMQITFSKQNNVDLTIVTDYINGPQTGSGLGSFITGNGNKFTVFTEITGIMNGYPFKSVDIYSGEITPAGIANFYHAGMVTDEAPTTIKRGQGRLSFDSDGFSQKISP